MQVGFLTTGLERPSYRFRIEPFIPQLLARRHQAQTLVLPSGWWNRLKLYRQLQQFDVLVVQRRLFSRPELLLLRRSCRRLIYDFDDAVMFDSRGRSCRRKLARFGAMVEAADLTICGNAFLAGHAAQFSDRLAVVPTAIDTGRFHPGVRERSAGPVTIGWTGSPSTNRYMNAVLPFLGRLDGDFCVRVMSGSTAHLDFARLRDVPCSFVKWSAETEVSQTASFDIGLMPLPDNNWTRGKCGCKALQYMALGIPAVCSPVGVNAEIIQQDQNGFLAGTDAEWISILNRLVRDPQLRRTIGENGRRTVEQKYSVAVQGIRFAELLEGLAASRCDLNRKTAG